MCPSVVLGIHGLMPLGIFSWTHLLPWPHTFTYKVPSSIYPNWHRYGRYYSAETNSRSDLRQLPKQKGAYSRLMTGTRRQYDCRWCWPVSHGATATMIDQCPPPCKRRVSSSACTDGRKDERWPVLSLAMPTLLLASPSASLHCPRPQLEWECQCVTIWIWWRLGLTVQPQRDTTDSSTGQSTESPSTYHCYYMEAEAVLVSCKNLCNSF